MQFLKIKIIGVGGAGVNAVNRLIASGIQGAQFWAVNTDLQSLNASAAPNKLPLGKDLTKGLGAGGDPEVGQACALNAKEEVLEILSDTQLAIFIAGLGGGTGSGAIPLLTQWAKDLGIMTLCFVAFPFDFEGKARGEVAQQALNQVKGKCDGLVISYNEDLLKTVDRKTPLLTSLALSDEQLKKDILLEMGSLQSASKTELLAALNLQEKDYVSWQDRRNRLYDDNFVKLKDQVLNRYHIPWFTPRQIQDLVLNTALKHPQWSPAEIRQRLMDQEQNLLLLSVEDIKFILNKNKLLEGTSPLYLERYARVFENLVDLFQKLPEDQRSATKPLKRLAFEIFKIRHPRFANLYQFIAVDYYDQRIWSKLYVKKNAAEVEAFLRHGLLSGLESRPETLVAFNKAPFSGSKGKTKFQKICEDLAIRTEFLSKEDKVFKKLLKDLKKVMDESFWKEAVQEERSFEALSESLESYVAQYNKKLKYDTILK